MWGPDVPVVPPPTALRWFSIAVLGFVSLGTLVSYARPQIPAVRREYPFDGLVSELGGLEENKVGHLLRKGLQRDIDVHFRRGWRTTPRQTSRSVSYRLQYCMIRLFHADRRNNSDAEVTL